MLFAIFRYSLFSLSVLSQNSLNLSQLTTRIDTLHFTQNYTAGYDGYYIILQTFLLEYKVVTVHSYSIPVPLCCHSLGFSYTMNYKLSGTSAQIRCSFHWIMYVKGTSCITTGRVPLWELSMYSQKVCPFIWHVKNNNVSAGKGKYNYTLSLIFFWLPAYFSILFHINWVSFINIGLDMFWVYKHKETGGSKNHVTDYMRVYNRPSRRLKYVSATCVQVTK